MNNTVISDPLRRHCLLGISNAIFKNDVNPHSLITVEICNKHAREILSFMTGRIDIEPNLTANITYTGIPFALRVARELTTSSNAFTSTAPTPITMAKPEAIPSQPSSSTSIPTPRNALGTTTAENSEFPSVG